MADATENVQVFVPPLESVAVKLFAPNEVAFIATPEQVEPDDGTIAPISGT